MKWLTLEYIKAHSRLCCDAEDDELTMLAGSAEDSILQLCGRTYDEFIEKYETIPAPIVHASLELVEHFYQNRGIVTPGNLSVIPYNFNLLIKPYIRL